MTRVHHTEMRYLEILAVLLVVVTGCTYSGEQVGKPVVHYVEISGFNFVPEKLEIVSGDFVSWTNKDVVPHNILSSGNETPLSPDLATGDTYTYSVQQSLQYACGLHPSMKGELVVLPLP